MSERFALTHRIARQHCISLEKENHNNIGTPLDFRQGNDIRIATLMQYFKKVVFLLVEITIFLFLQTVIQLEAVFRFSEVVFIKRFLHAD